MEKERELRDFQRREDAATDEDVKRVLQYMIEVTVEALKLNFKKEEISGFAKLVVGARAVEMRWVSMPQAQLINSIWCPLPFPLWGNGRGRGREPLHNAHDGNEGSRLLIYSKTNVSETKNSADCSASAQEGTNNTLFHSESTVKRKFLVDNHSITQYSEHLCDTLMLQFYVWCRLTYLAIIETKVLFCP